MKYHLYKSFFSLLSRLPWCVLTAMSRSIAALLRGPIAYRRDVVLDNLRRSFPEKSEAERQRVARDFYNHLVFQFLSSPKLLAQPTEVLKREHMLIEGFDVFAKLKAQGKPISLILMGHCGNWELFSAGQIYFSEIGIQQEQLYRPLKDEALDRVQLEMRSALGAMTTPKDQVGRRLIHLMRQKPRPGHTIAFIADQTPRQGGRVGLWADFLNQPTAFLDGAERLAVKYQLPVVYLDITRHSNRCYTGRMELLCDAPQLLPKHELTKRYIRALELTIRRDPACWLWSHRRWKLTPPQEKAETLQTN
ncbi:MAG: lysophospholipid acyltransferase family protein [Porphyromonadaceae bacterium]|nr:lysophospholipid acyltransferase family protein [Porphyromonadaceae bacterium]